MEDIEIYNNYDIQPRIILSQCSFRNLYTYGMEMGSDVCIHVEDENFKCENCELARQTEKWYPAISSFVLLQLALLLKPDIEVNCEFDTIKNNIFKYAESKPELKPQIKDILQAHVEEYGRY